MEFFSRKTKLIVTNYTIVIHELLVAIVCIKPADVRLVLPASTQSERPVSLIQYQITHLNYFLK
jgi:hypothetical protein